ncbi:PREDICTED: uncharacterized protein LOC104385299, partial [Chaetura pelagica]|uniref:uncharacterized protein LOC104385299 n=1 Tax=Chaetura pelagica TaxID=8897 RepID=UPI000523C4B4
REPWWNVDGPPPGPAVTIKNRQDCCWQRLRGAQVHVGDAPGERGRDNPICGVVTDAGPGSLSTICCQGLVGRYVSVLIPGREDVLVLCEVEVALQGCFPLPGAPNAALGRAVAQSSTLDSSSLAANAVDGNDDPDWGHGSCSHTGKELEPWWRVDLGGRHAVYAVTVTTSSDCCWKSLLGAQVHVGDSLADHGKRNPVCGAILDTGPGSTTTICCNGLPGRYVSILIPGREEFLTLCEVQNLALRRPASQSSTSGRSGDAINAVDGNRDGNWLHGSCSQTELEREPCCGTITDTGPGSTSTICCRGQRGRYLTLWVPGRQEQLSLCQGEVVELGCSAPHG